MPSASSTSEIVYKLIKHYQTPIGKECALCLYTGLMFDTGCFRYSNTTPETHRIAAELIEIGEFAPDEVYRNVYEQLPVAKLRLLSEVLSTLQVTDDGKIASVYATQEMFRKTGTNTDAVEGIVNQIQAIAGVEVALCVSEMTDRSTKVSLRSQGHVDVSQLAAEFEGGGHARAAGCRLVAPYLTALTTLVQTAQRYMDQSSSEYTDCTEGLNHVENASNRSDLQVAPTTCRLNDIAEFERETVVTFGVFDGIHIGHQTVIDTLLKRAAQHQLMSVLIGFYPHPLAFLAPERCPPLLTPLSKRVEILQHLGIDKIIMLHFDAQIAAMSPEYFVEQVLLKKCRARHVVVGYACQFGKDRAGNAQKLVELSQSISVWGHHCSTNRNRLAHLSIAPGYERH